MGDDVEHVARGLVDDGESVDLVVNEWPDGIEQRLGGGYADQRPVLIVEHAWEKKINISKKNLSIS